MEGKLRKWKNKRDILKLLQYRENSAEASTFFKQHSQFTDSLIKRLGLEFELEGHKGCVNCLQWTPDGKHLASGSDDTNVILWDPFRHKQLQVIPTHHIGNIFSVKFLGNGTNEIATAAGDCRVLVQSISGAVAKSPPLLECSCHVNRVKRLATSPIEPSLFWSAAEDGLVIQYDLREPHECSQSQTKVLVDLSQNFGEVKCIAVNPTKPHYIAVGANDCYIRMYDRRMLKTTMLGQVNSQVTDSKTTDREPVDPKCVQYYAPGHLAVENANNTNFKLAATYISFNTAGSEMLVNMGGEQIYLFDINNTRHINELQVPQFMSGRRKTPIYKCCCHPEGNGFVSTMKDNDFTEENCACYYMRRGYKCYRRKWMGDLYSAARDYLYVTQMWPDQKQAYIGLIKSLIALKWANEAQQWMEYFCATHPDYAVSSQIKILHDALEGIKAANSPKEKGSDSSEPKERYLRKVDEPEQKRRMDSKDYEVRFLGHCNTTTDIKEANFLGEDGNYICAGSDEGIIFIWERRHSSIVTALFGDVSIVNCIQPHPSACFIASSGIDLAVKLWSPMPEDDKVNPRIVKDINAVVEANQQRMSMDPFESMLVNMGYSIPGFTDAPTYQELPSCRTC